MSSSYSEGPAVSRHSNHLLGYEEAAEILGVAKGTLYAWVSQGRVPCVRFSPRCVRFQRTALEAFVQEREVAVSEPVFSATAAYNGVRKQG